MLELNKRITFFLILTYCITGCDAPLESSNSKKGIKDGVVKQYRAGKVLKNEITYKDGKRHGLAKTYYKDGSLRQTINYAYDLKEGEAITYYENGKRYQITPYVKDTIEGVRKRFRQNGQLMAEIPYSKGLPCKGLKEYLLDRSLKRMYPTIVFRPKDEMLKSNIYELEIMMSDGSKNVEYYTDVLLSEGGCLLQRKDTKSNYKPGVMKLTYNMPPNTFIMQEIEVVAVVKTVLGNPYITSAKYNLAIENRGF